MGNNNIQVNNLIRELPAHKNEYQVTVSFWGTRLVRKQSGNPLEKPNKLSDIAHQVYDLYQSSDQNETRDLIDTMDHFYRESDKKINSNFTRLFVLIRDFFGFNYKKYFNDLVQNFNHNPPKFVKNGEILNSKFQQKPLKVNPGMIKKAISQVAPIHQDFTSIHSIESQQTAHEVAKEFLTTHLPLTGAELEIISSPCLPTPSYKDVQIEPDLNPKIFCWEKTSGVEDDIQRDGKRRKKCRVIYAAASQFNGCEATQVMTIKPGEACTAYAGDKTQGPTAQLQFSKDQVELINCAGNLGFNGLCNILDESTKNSVQHGYFRPTKLHYESVKEQLSAGGVEYICIGNKPIDSKGQKNNDVHLILVSAHAYGATWGDEYINGEEANEIQFLCALNAYRAQFKQCVHMANKNKLPLIFKPAAIGMGAWGNDPQVIAQAFYQAAKECENILVDANVQVIFQVWRNPYNPYFTEEEFLLDGARQLVGHLGLNEQPNPHYKLKY
jgi:hypothetical protein